MNQSKVITEGALFSALYLLLLLITLYIPVIGTVSTFILPVPFILFASRHGWKPTLLVAIAAMILTALLANPLLITVTLFMVCGGTMIGSAMHHNRSAYETWARGAVGFVIGILLMLLIAQFLLGVNMIDTLNQAIDQSVKQAEGITKQFLPSGNMDDAVEMLENEVMLMKNLIPAIVALIGIILGFISQWVSYKLANRVWQTSYQFPTFRGMRLPASLIWLFLLVLILSFFNLDPNGTLYLLVENGMILLSLLMAMQGFSFIFFITHHKNMSKALPIIGLVVTLFIPFLFLLVSILGVFDIGSKLRDRITQGGK